MALHLAGVVVKDDADKILLIHRSTPQRTHWEIPGGKIEEGETPAQTAEREAFEELAATVEIIRELGSASFSEDGDDFFYTWFLAAPTVGSTPTVGEPEIFDDVRYWSIADLVTTDETISANTHNFVKEITSGNIRL